MVFIDHDGHTHRVHERVVIRCTKMKYIIRASDITLMTFYRWL